MDETTKNEKDENGDTRHPHAMLSAAGVATGEQVPTSSPGHVSTLSIHYLASGSRREQISQ